MASMTMDEFDAKFRQRGSHRPPSLQTLAIRNMQPGQVLQLGHKDVRCKNGRSCTIMRAITIYKKVSPYHFRAMHLPNGDIVVACTTKEALPTEKQEETS